MNRKYVGYGLILIGILIFGFVFYINSKYDDIIRPFSSYTLLTSSWEKYKDKFIDKDGRVVDFSAGDITTSEGQSYAMLRAVFIDDKGEFNRVWKWTKDNLKRPTDNLFGWRWGRNNDNNYGFMENGGMNSASDADTDIAFALILATKRWGDAEYQEEALEILDDLWEIETDVAANKRYLLAGNWAKNANELVINPSYFAPYAFRVFAVVDEEHDWESLIEPGYQMLSNSGQAPLDKSKGVGLPPDWVIIDRQTGDLRATNMGNLTSNYSYDAIRVPWRIALDYQWNNNKEAYDYLLNNFKFLGDEYFEKGTIPTEIAHDGQIINHKENPAVYATSLGYFKVIQPNISEKIYQDKIIRLYSNDTNTFDFELSYYDQNWLWFGAALHNNFLVNFFDKKD